MPSFSIGTLAVVRLFFVASRLIGLPSSNTICALFSGLSVWISSLRHRAFDCAQIAARIFRHRRQARPRRVVVGDLDILHGRQIDGVQLDRSRT